MKNDLEEQKRQLPLDFDSATACGEVASLMRQPVVLSLAYSSGANSSRLGDSQRKQAAEREMIISQTVSFARKLSW